MQQTRVTQAWQLAVAERDATAGGSGRADKNRVFG